MRLLKIIGRTRAKRRISGRVYVHIQRRVREMVLANLMFVGAITQLLYSRQRQSICVRTYIHDCNLSTISREIFFQLNDKVVYPAFARAAFVLYTTHMVCNLMMIIYSYDSSQIYKSIEFFVINVY